MITDRDELLRLAWNSKWKEDEQVPNKDFIEYFGEDLCRDQKMSNLVDELNEADDSEDEDEGEFKDSLFIDFGEFKDLVWPEDGFYSKNPAFASANGPSN